MDTDTKRFWASASLRYFGFFQSGEITVPTVKVYKPEVHLSWGDVMVDNLEAPTVVQLQTNQFGRGAKVF